MSTVINKRKKLINKIVSDLGDKTIPRCENAIIFMKSDIPSSKFCKIISSVDQIFKSEKVFNCVCTSSLS